MISHTVNFINLKHRIEGVLSLIGVSLNNSEYYFSSSSFSAVLRVRLNSFCALQQFVGEALQHSGAGMYCTCSFCSPDH